MNNIDDIMSMFSLVVLSICLLSFVWYVIYSMVKDDNIRHIKELHKLEKKLQNK